MYLLRAVRVAGHASQDRPQTCFAPRYDNQIIATPGEAVGIDRPMPEYAPEINAVPGTHCATVVRSRCKRSHAPSHRRCGTRGTRPVRQTRWPAWRV